MDPGQEWWISKRGFFAVKYARSSVQDNPNLEENMEPANTKIAQNTPRNIALKKFQENDRVKNVRLIISEDCCPVCATYEGTYEKYDAPYLPIEGCSHPKGCRCFYEPLLTVIYP